MLNISMHLIFPKQLCLGKEKKGASLLPFPMRAITYPMSKEGKICTAGA